MQVATHELVEHIRAPYSSEALSAEIKPLQEVGSVSFIDIPRVSTGITPHLVKASGENPALDEQPDQYLPVHTLFCGGLKEVLGEELFEAARDYFDHVYAEFCTGERRTFGLPHLDGTAPGGYNAPALYTVGESGAALKLVGTASNTLPTIGLQGSTMPEDYEGEPKTHLKTNVVGNLTPEEFPTDELVIAPPSLPHYSQKAKRFTRRHFLRWQVMIDL